MEEYRRWGRATVRVWKVGGGEVVRDLGGQVTGVIHAKASTSLVVVVGGTSVVRLDKKELVDSTVKDEELHKVRGGLLVHHCCCRMWWWGRRSWRRGRG